jgi:hypothetical protein
MDEGMPYIHILLAGHKVGWHECKTFRAGSIFSRWRQVCESHEAFETIALVTCSSWLPNYFKLFCQFCDMSCPTVCYLISASLAVTVWNHVKVLCDKVLLSEPV